MSRTALRFPAAVAAIVALAASASPRIAHADPLNAPQAIAVAPGAGARTEVFTEPKDASGHPVTGATFLAETSFGSVTSVTETSPGRYAAALTIPPADMPRAVLVVFAPQGRGGIAPPGGGGIAPPGGGDLAPAWALIPVSVLTTLTAHTEPRSTVTAKVGSRSFGPVEAGRDGSFSLDIELAPGARKTEVRLQDAAGNVTNSEIAVPLREHDPLTVTLDRYRVSSDGSGTARVFAFTFDDTGKPLRGARPSATASAGEISAFTEDEPGLWTARYSAPKDGREGMADIEVTLVRGKTRATELDRVAIVRGLPGSLKLQADPMELVSGTTHAVALSARVTDSAGNALPAQPVRMFADRGTLSEVADRGDGTYTATLTPPVEVGSGSLEVKALLPVGGPAKTPARLALSANPETVPTSWRAFSLVTAQLADADGNPVAGEVVLFHVSRGEGTVTPAAITLGEGRAFADFAADPTEEVVTVEAVSTTVPSLRAEVRIEKKRSGEFTILTRPAVLAQGGMSNAVMKLGDDKRVLQDAVMLTMVAGEPARLVASADPTRLPADGASQSALTARLLDAAGNEVREQQLSWSVDRGTLSGDAEDDDGVHRSTLTAPEGRGTGRVTVTVSHAGSGLSATLPIDLDLGPAARIALSSDKTTLPADGQARATLTAELTDASGAAIPGARVRFRVTSGEAAVDPESTTGPSGAATASLVASLMPGPVEIEAATADGALTASVSVDLMPLRPERLTVSATPSSIRADGVERSEILAVLEDGIGERMKDQPVRFELRGPALLTGTRAFTAFDGEARTWLSGTEAGVVTVRVIPELAPALAEDVQVALLGDTLPVTFTAGAPACDGAVMLHGVAPGAVSFSWDWTGDGVADATGADVSAPLQAGDRPVTLTVRDAAGLTGSATSVVTVGPRPRATIEPVAEHVASGATVHLDGSASSGGTGLLTWSWDIDGDGATDGDQPDIEWTDRDGLRSAVLTVTDELGCSDTDSVRVLFGSPPDLSTTIAVTDNASVRPGEIATLTVGWANAGPTSATGTELWLTLSGLATFVPSALPPGTRVVSSQEVVVALGTLAARTSGNFKVQALADATMPGGLETVTATSHIASPLGDADPSDDSASASFVIRRDVDLVATLASSATSPLHAGDATAVTLTVRNAGGSAAPGAVAELSWDSALFTASGISGATGVPGSPARLDLGDIAPGAAVTRTLSGAVRPVLPDPDQMIQFSVQASYPGIDANPADDDARLALRAVAAPDLSVTLTASTAHVPALPGDAVDYVATWTNRGTTDAGSVTLTSRMTAGTLAGLLDNPSGGQVSGDVVTFVLGTVAAGGTGQVRWTAQLASDVPPSLTSACNDVSIDEPAGLDTNLANDTASACVAVDAQPALTVAVSAPPMGSAGAPLTVTVTVTNGGAPAAGVDLELQLSGARASAGGPAGNPVTARFSVGALARNASATWRQQVVLSCPQDAVDPVLRAQAVALLGGVASSNVATSSTTVIARPDVSARVSLPASAAAGDAVAGQATLTNIGCAPCDAAGATITWDAALAGGPQPLSVGGGMLPAGGSATLPFSVTALPVLPGISNDMTVTAVASCALDADASNDMASAVTTLTAEPDVRVVSVDVPPAIPAGTSAEAIVTIESIGTTAARSVDVSLVRTDLASPLSIAPSSVAVALLPVGSTAQARFTLTAPPLLAAPAVPAAIQAAASYPNDGDPGNDLLTATTVMTAAPDLRLEPLEIVTSAVPPPPGSVVTVRATVENVGTTLSQGASLSLERDDALLLATDPGDASSVVTRALPVLLPGDRTTVAFRFVLVSPLPAGADVTTLGARAADALDTNPANDSQAADLRVGDVVDIAVDVTLSDDGSPAAGESVRATIKAVNDGRRDATGVGAAITWSPAALVASASGLPPGAVLVPGGVEWSPFDLPAGDPGKTWDLILQLAPSMPGLANTLTVQASLLSDPAVNPENVLSNNQDSATLVASAEADLCTDLVASFSPSRPLPGGTVTYTATVQNRGTTAASGTVIDLAFDAWLGTAVSSSPGATAAPGRLTWAGIVLAPSASVTRSATFTIPAFAPGEVTRFIDAVAGATASEDGPAGCTGTSATVSTTITTQANLVVTKRLLSATTNPPQRGAQLTYEVAVTNAGNSPSVPGTLTDQIPPETTFVSANPAATASGGTITWGVGAIAPGVTLVYRAVLAVDATLAPGAYVLHNVAEVATAQDANPADDVAVHDLPMNLDVDLVTSMACAADPAPPTPGSDIECTGSVVNRGSYPATNPRLLADVGSLATLVAGGSSSAVIPLAGPLNPGASVPFSFRLRSLPVLPALSNTIAITATAAADEPDAVVADNAATASVGVAAWVDLHAELSALDATGGPPLVAGDVVEMTLRVSNAGGTTPAQPVALTASYDDVLLDVVPGGDMTGSGGTLTGALTAPLAPSDPPATVRWSYVVAATLPAPENPFRPCAAASAAGERSPNDDRDCVDGLTIVAWPDLVTTLTAVPPTNPALPGQVVEYQATVVNRGTTGATAVTLTDDRDETLTSGLTGASVPATDNGRVITMTLPNLAVGVSTTATWRVGLAPTMPAQSTAVATTACAASAEPERTPADNCAGASVNVFAAVDARVAVAVTLPSGACTPGSQVVATVTATNAGLAPAPAAVMTLDIPAGLVLVSAAGWSGGSSPLTFDAGSLAPGAAVVAPAVTLRVADTLPDASNTLPLTARVTHGATDANLADNQDTRDVSCQAWADVAVTIARSSAVPAPALPVAYHVTWRNEGSTTARAATLTVADDAQLVVPGSGADPGSLGRVYALGDLAPGANGTLDLSYAVKPVLPLPANTLVERVTIATTTPEQDLADDTAEVRDTVAARADFWSTITLTPPQTPARPNDLVTATVAYGNSGETASAGTLTVTLDPNVDFVSASGTPDTSALPDVRFPITLLAPGATGQVTVTFRIKAVMPGPTTNVYATSEAASVVTDLNAANDADAALVPVVAAPDLVVRVRLTSPAPPVVQAGSTLDGEIEIVNQGSTRATATGATVRPLESGIVASAQCLDGPCTTAGDTITWTLGQVDVAPGVPLVKRFRLTMGRALPAVSNVLTVEGRAYCNESEISVANNVATAAATVEGKPDLRLVSVTADRNVVRPGDLVRFDYQYKNVGSAPADPAELYVGFADAAQLLPLFGSGATPTTGALTFDWGGPLAPGASANEWASCLVQGQAPPPTVRDIAQTATARERSPLLLSRDANPGDNSATLTIKGCYLSLRASFTQVASQTCMGSGVSIIADATPSTNVVYSYWAEGGLGRFSDPTARTTTYFPPVTAAGASYRIHVVVSDATDPSCTVEQVMTVTTTTACRSCGCSPVQFNVQYNGAFSRLDRLNDHTATQGETVGFRVSLRETQNVKAGWLLGGPGYTRMTFSDGTNTWTGYLNGNVWVDCDQVYQVEFGPAPVPRGMAIGDQPIKFEFYTRDDCGSAVQRDVDNNTGDRVQILAAPAGAAGIVFTDWGPGP